MNLASPSVAELLILVLAISMRLALCSCPKLSARTSNDIAINSAYSTTAASMRTSNHVNVLHVS